MSSQATEFKVKGLDKIELKNGQKQEVELEGIEGGKVLLVKVKDEVHAMSANCTHYGAPLKLGVVTGEGRITCAWHGGMWAINSVRWTSACLNMADIYEQLALTLQLVTSKMHPLLIRSPSLR